MSGNQSICTELVLITIIKYQSINQSIFITFHLSRPSLSHSVYLDDKLLPNLSKDGECAEVVYHTTMMCKLQ